MVVARDAKALAAAFERASTEAEEAFGDGSLFVERFVERARHVEVQVMGDGKGRVLHFGERDCSLQRRYQKMIEEAPAVALPSKTRARLHQAAIDLLAAVNYRNAGTVEFLYDVDRDELYFMEVNARIQVEHPVTEAITGLDLVAEQIAIAEGRGLRLRQADVRLDGHAIEGRITAEDPAADFRPSPGTVTSAVFPAGPGIRVDTHVQAGSAVPAQYDSLLAKLVVTGADRDQALARLRGALARCRIDGVATNLSMLAALARDGEFAAGGVDTGYLARWLERQPGEAWCPGREPSLVRDKKAGQSRG
jgi:acetyl-CoA carboxylase biotin carboxylase subunit